MSFQTSNFQNISVVVIGATGRMGQPIVKTILEHPRLKLAGAIARHHTNEDIATHIGLSQPCGVTISTELEVVLAQTQADVAVDVTQPEAALNNALTCLHYGTRPVIGTSGMGDEAQAALQTALAQADSKLSALVVPNFAVGAVLMMHFAAVASQFFNHAEIVEYHHNRKLDAPSGTSIQTATKMAHAAQSHFNPPLVEETETLPGARGGKGAGEIPIHSIRLPGMVAHQEVLFGDAGQLLTLRHDSFNRESFMPGVVMAIERAITTTGLEVGLETAMGLNH